MATLALAPVLRASSDAPAPTTGGRDARGYGGWLTLMRRGWLRGVHRAVAALVLCSLMAFQLESLIADVCDGDATPAELAAFTGPASDLPSNAAALAAARTASAASEAVASASGSGADQSAPSPTPTHAAHACHCVHAHGGVLPRVEHVGVATVATSTAVPSLRDLAPPSVTAEPRLRPPLA